MNDRCLFRGKRVDNGEWAIGSLLLPNANCDKYIIVYDNMEGFCCEKEVVFETIGQWTTLKDKNGKLVFENDVLCVEDWEQCKETGNMINFLGNVYWDNINLCWSVKDEHNDLTWFDIDGYKLEVIGNIHQDSHLLGGK